MNVTLLHIEAPSAAPPTKVRVQVEIDGQTEWHTMLVEPSVLAGQDARLLVASEAMQDRFRQDPLTLHRICRLVSQTLRGHPVRVPQLLAA